MAATLPPKLKVAGITPFAIRAVQLESAKPVISYWCYYWVVQQILKQQLHNVDEECFQYTATVMDKLEEMKTDNVDNDAILDDVAGQAYVEQFAQETLDRALRTLKANRVTQQTASTFEAAATFFQLVNIWGSPDDDTREKIKYSKWNAARILKAIKEGKDPNESNPKFEEEEVKPEESTGLHDPNHPSIDSSQPRPVTVEEVHDDDGMPPYSLRKVVQVSAPNSPLPPTAPVPDQVSPIAPPDVPSQDPGSYFPNAPSETGGYPLDLPSTASMPRPGSSGHHALGPAPDVPDHRGTSPSRPFASCGSPSSPKDFYHTQHQDNNQHETAPTPPPFIQHQQRYNPSPAPHPPHNYHVPHSRQTTSAPPPPAQQQGSNSGPTGSHNYDDMVIAQAQKHAKWAISALNFEDVPTAIRELEAALSTLGAR